MSSDEKHYDEKHGVPGVPYDEKADAVVSGVPAEEEDLETTHIGEHGIRRDLVSEHARVRPGPTQTQTHADAR